jgi:NhaA family Na+:H+ antiporter
MIVPALIYIALNSGASGRVNGWAIPCATDIAFALGVLSLLGRSAPASLKIYLAALAIVDDLGAVLIIAFFYTANLSLPMLVGAGGVLALLFVLNRAGVRSLPVYLALGVPLWILTFLSGVHATIAGVALALVIPIDIGVGAGHEAHSPLHRLEHALAPWIAYLVVPVFGFANAGVSFAGFSAAALLNPITLGVGLGLFVGKQLGVFAFAMTAIKLGFAQMPAGSSARQLYGVALLCGIGFTMSLFVGLLAFPGDAGAVGATKIGVLFGSLLSAVFGAIVLKSSGKAHGRH